MTRPSLRGELFKQRVAQSAAASPHRRPLSRQERRGCGGLEAGKQRPAGRFMWTGLCWLRPGVCSLSQERAEVGEEGKKPLGRPGPWGEETVGSGLHVV